MYIIQQHFQYYIGSIILLLHSLFFFYVKSLWSPRFSALVNRLNYAQKQKVVEWKRI